ncbi:TIGR01440 family protein [Paenibacillus sp. HB172176]|uniref:TIGR01440 family protein n=1 Tax=Paenibacillus sp. HB172176 TaxID=2493690 RepID=UPI00197FC88B|nr:TIGR01440 family protein [Paenibacillus sp. HB172176]
MSPEHGKLNSYDITLQVERVVRELAEAGKLKVGELLVIGTSTSEVIGRRIGTSGALETAAAIYAGIESVRNNIPFISVFQCCEHLNRALVIERSAAEHYRLPIVQAVPVPTAGGSMAAYAYTALEDPCLVESVEAHAGIDIGDTFIGMHLKRVAVPIRPSIKMIGSAHVTMAITRPKLIGGARAVYAAEEATKPGQAARHCE